MPDALRDHDPELGKMRPECVRQHRLLPDQQRPRAMQHENSLLVGAFDRDKPHVRPAHRLANRFRIRGVVLSTLDIGLYVSRPSNHLGALLDLGHGSADDNID